MRDHAIETRAGKVSATTSVGAVWLPLAAATSQEAMLRAEQALERARINGRDGFAVYAESPQRDTARLRQMGIADEVILALKENRLRLAYQPIIDAKTRKSAHYECLLRMLRPDGQEITAGHFVPATEQMGIVHLVDRFALETAVTQLKRHDEISLGVNVSGTAAADPVWLQSFVDYVRDNRDVADRLVVELTETAALHQFEENARFVSQLRELGVRVAIDDFGAGYTSFRNLQMMHVDVVKIDGSYIKDLSVQPAEPGLCPHPDGAGQESRHARGGRMGRLGRRRRPAGKLRRGLFPGLPFRRTPARTRLVEKLISTSSQI